MSNPFHTCTGNPTICDASGALYREAIKTARDLDLGATTEDEVTASIHAALSDLAARAPGAIDRDFALDACRALGRTIGHWMVVSDGGLGANGWLLREEIEDLEATMELVLATPDLRRSAGAGVEANLTAAAGLEPADVADGQHHAELFLATATASALVGSAAA